MTTEKVIRCDGCKGIIQGCDTLVEIYGGCLNIVIPINKTREEAIFESLRDLHFDTLECMVKYLHNRIKEIEEKVRKK